MTIDKDVPLPRRVYGPRANKYPFAQMQPGDSAFFPGENHRDKHHPAYMTARNYVKRQGWKMVLRSVVEDGVPGVRIWRVT